MCFVTEMGGVQGMLLCMDPSFLPLGPTLKEFKWTGKLNFNATPTVC